MELDASLDVKDMCLDDMNEKESFIEKDRKVDASTSASENAPSSDVTALISSVCGGPLPSIGSGPRSYPTLIFFDWDDTLLASSHLASHGCRLDSPHDPPEEILQHLDLLQASVLQVLSLAARHGEVVIVTNAEHGWVQLSAEKWMPRVLDVVRQLPVISARSTFEEKYPASPFQWKYHAMNQALSKAREQYEEAKHGLLHVMSLGDSHVEREAVRAVTSQVENIRTKSVKFAEHPTMEQLRRQLDLVHSSFQYIHSHDGDLDLMLTINVVY